MERKDIKGINHHLDPNDKVLLEGTGREAELIVAGLKLLAAQVAIRDVTVTYDPYLDIHTHPSGRRGQGRGVPLSGEVDGLLSQIATANYIK